MEGDRNLIFNTFCLVCRSLLFDLFNETEDFVDFDFCCSFGIEMKSEKLFETAGEELACLFVISFDNCFK
jgi:hypothetical protein